MFENIRKYDRPVVLHVITKKGRGGPNVDTSPDALHGISPKSKETKLEPKSKRAAVDPKAKIEEGDEEVETAGRKFKCHWVKSTTDKGWETTWTSDDAPGRIVKAQGEGQGRKWKRWLGAIEMK